MSGVPHPLARFALSAAACAVLGACDAEDRNSVRDTTVISEQRTAAVSDDRNTATVETPTVDSAVAAGAVTSTRAAGATVLAILDAANSGAIETGRLAQQKATSTAVKAFARRVVDEHTALRRQGSELARRLNIAATLPDDDEFVKDYREEVGELQDKTGDPFNEEFTEHEIESHEKLIEEIDDALETVQNEELRQFLLQARSTLEAHREAAEEVREGLDG